jgi:hypothetical protein
MFSVWIGDLALAGGQLASSAGCRCRDTATRRDRSDPDPSSGTVAENTDPLLALILAMILGLSDRLENLRSNSLAR